MADDITDKQLELQKIRLEIWKQAIATSMHFTEMSGRTRQIGLAFVVAAIGLGITLLAQYREARIPIVAFGYQFDLHVSGLIIMLAGAGLFAVMLLDLRVYHRMLRGSVAFSTSLERSGLRDDVMKTEQGLTESISHYSRATFDREGKVKSIDKVTAELKIQKFYLVAIASICGLGLAIVWFTAHVSEHRVIINQTIEYQDFPEPKKGKP